MVASPDLLYEEPLEADAGRDLQQALTFAFTTGGPQAAFDRVRESAPGSDPEWKGDCYADQLLLPALVEHCLVLPPALARRATRPGRVASLVALLCRPPATPTGVAFRQGIVRELSESAEVRKAAESAYLRIAEWRALLEASAIGQRMDPVRRRMELLGATKAVFDELATSFAASSSGLRRLAGWAESVRQTAAYENLGRLVADDANLATIEVSVRVGREGDLRHYEILRVEDRRDNPLRVGPLRRLWARLQALVLGHRVRKDEIASRLVDGAFEAIQPHATRLFDVQRDLDLYLGALGFADLARTRGLPVCLPTLGARGDASAPRAFDGLFNPFLLLDERPPVPCELHLDCADALVIVTGPNSGGKTRLVEAVGIAQILAHAGLWVPAASARLPWAHGLYASLRHLDGMLHREGSLGTELLRIRTLFERLEIGGLVVVDELCSGTNPSEGEEIFELVMSLLAEMRAQAFVTTHFLRFAGRLETERPIPRLEFRKVALDARDRPTYRFEPGVASTSLARQTADRLGVTREELGALVAEKRRRRR
jgi:DNA mismatch repair protein MutS2